ncbi:MAG: DUF6458 family protein [Acidimicrobiales bacterium]
MNTYSGSSLLGLGVVLAAVGAILDFAVTVQTSGFNINEVGLILLIVGIIAFVVGLGILVAGSQRRSVVREDIRNVPGGQQRTVERNDRLP